MNPCPCGFLLSENNRCTCSPNQIQKYRAKVSGPLLDRIDIHIEVPEVPHKHLMQESIEEPSASIRQRVNPARNIQSKRFKRTKIYCNAQMGSRHIKKHCNIDEASKNLLEAAIDKLGLSARAYHRILKIARTIADLEDSKDIQVDHVSESIQYRSMDRTKDLMY